MAKPGAGLRQMQKEFDKRNRETNRFFNKTLNAIIPKKSRRKYRVKVSKKTNSSKNIVNSEPVVTISSGDIGNYQNVEFSEVTKMISFYIKLNRLSNFLLLVFLLFVIVFSGWLMWISIIITLAVVVLLKIFTRACCNNLIQYDTDDYALSLHNSRVSNIETMNHCDRLWQVTSYQNITNKRVNAGVNRSVSRKVIRVIEKTPFYLKTNVTVPNIKLASERIYFLPDQILLVKGSKVGSVKYEDIKVNYTNSNFVESLGRPRDSKLICMTWQFVNNNGTPDKRFKNNRQLPKLLYGCITITSSAGLNIQLLGSNHEVMNKIKVN